MSEAAWEHLAWVRRSEIDDRVWLCDLAYSTHIDTQAGGLRAVQSYAQGYVRDNVTDGHFAATRWRRVDGDLLAFEGRVNDR